MNYNENIGYIINESAIPGFVETNIINQDKKGRVTAEAVLQVADETNRNGRIYPYNELIPQLYCPRLKELLESGYLLGEMGHPLSTDLVRQQTIDQTRSCVRFLKIWNEGPVVKCNYRGTNNAFGDTINEDLLDGCKPAFSLRALGTLSKTERGTEVHNLRIINWDCVIYPSHKSAYTQKVLDNNGQPTNESVIGESAIIEPKTHLQQIYEQYFGKDSDILTEDAKIIPITNKNVIDLIIRKSDNIKYVGEMFDFAYKDISIMPDGKKARLVSENGDVAMVNLEQQIANEIMNYCDEMDKTFNY